MSGLNKPACTYVQKLYFVIYKEVRCSETYGNVFFSEEHALEHKKMCELNNPRVKKIYIEEVHINDIKQGFYNQDVERLIKKNPWVSTFAC